MKFKVGDRVFMRGPQIFRGREITDVLPPVEGEVTSIAKVSGLLVYNVTWHNTETGKRGSNYMDEACLEGIGPTEEELAEVMASLMGTPAPEAPMLEVPAPTTSKTLTPVDRWNLHKDQWLMQRIKKTLEAIRYSDREGLETELDLLAFAEDVLDHYEGQP